MNKITGKMRFSFLIMGLFWTGALILILVNLSKVTSSNIVAAIILLSLFAAGSLFATVIILIRRISIEQDGLLNDRKIFKKKILFKHIKKYNEIERKNKLPIFGLFMPMLTIGKYYELTFKMNDGTEHVFLDSRHISNYKEASSSIIKAIKEFRKV